MLYRARLPERKKTSKCGKKYYSKLPDEFFNDAILCISATNSVFSNPKYPRYLPYIFINCDNKPVDSELLKWESMESVKRTPYPINRGIRKDNKFSREKRKYPKLKTKKWREDKELQEMENLLKERFDWYGKTT